VDRCETVRMLYVDHAATSPMRPEVWEAMAPFAGEKFGNASGLHGIARQAKNALEEAREEAAALLGAAPMEIVFTSGGTESDNLAVKGAALVGGRRGGVVTTAIEHEAVLESAEFLSRFGCPVQWVQPSAGGVVSVDDVLAAVSSDTTVVSVMSANNETGIRQPVAELAGRMDGPLLHTDAVQAFASDDRHVGDLGVDLLSLAAHKFGGPKGVGLLYVRSGTNLEPVQHGGGQELGRRSGTHNAMGAVGMATAMRSAASQRANFCEQVRAERDSFESKVVKAGGVATGADVARLPQHAHVRLPDTTNETVLIRLDTAGVAAAAGSACQSGAVSVSHVLAAMGWDAEMAGGALRFTFGWTTEPGDGARAADALLAAWGKTP